MSMRPGHQGQIGDSILAFESGRDCARHGAPCVVPSWCFGSHVLSDAFHEGYHFKPVRARRQGGATDGAAR